MTLETLFLDNPLRDWLIALGVAVGVLLLLLTLRRVLVGRLTAFAERTATEWDDILASALGRTRLLFLVIVSAQAGAIRLDLRSSRPSPSSSGRPSRHSPTRGSTGATLTRTATSR